MRRSSLARKSVQTDYNVAQWDKLRATLSRRFSVERLTAGRIPDLCSFLKDAFARETVASHYRDLDSILARVRWLNEEQPLATNMSLPAWICLSQAHIVGHIGCLPAQAVIDQSTTPIVWARDLIVGREVRGMGVGTLMILTALLESDGTLFLGGLNDTVHSMYRRLGFVDMGKLPLFVKVLEPSVFLAALSPKLAQHSLLQRIAVVFVGVAQRARTRRQRSRIGIVTEEFPRFDDEFDSWWRFVESAYSCVVRRTSEEMNWRYVGHPVHKYKLLAARGKEGLRGVLICRRGVSRGLRAGIISEVLTHPDDQGAASALLDAGERLLMAAHGAPLTFLRTTVRGGRFADVLGSSGYLRAPSPNRWMIANRDGPSSQQRVCRRQSWMLNGGDSDFDFI